MPTHIPAITIFFLRHDPAPTEIYTLSLHDALPIFCFSRVISSGPKVSGRLAPILTPVQPLSLCEAVTIATQGTSRSNCAKYAIGVTASPMSWTLQPDAIRPEINAYLIEAE